MLYPLFEGFCLSAVDNLEESLAVALIASGSAGQVAGTKTKENLLFGSTSVSINGPVRKYVHAMPTTSLHCITKKVVQLWLPWIRFNCTEDEWD